MDRPGGSVECCSLDGTKTYKAPEATVISKSQRKLVMLTQKADAWSFAMTTIHCRLADQFTTIASIPIEELANQLLLNESHPAVIEIINTVLVPSPEDRKYFHDLGSVFSSLRQSDNNRLS